MDLFTMAVILNHLGGGNGEAERGLPAEAPPSVMGVATSEDVPVAAGEKPFAPPPPGDTIPAPNPPHVPF
jgi:hypothetical protein